MVTPCAGPVHHLDRVAGADLALPQHPQVRPGRGPRGEPLDQVGHAPEAGEGGARRARLGDLEQRVADGPLLADHRPGDVHRVGAEVLAEAAGPDAPAQFGRPPAGVLLGVGVDGLVGAAVVGPLADEVAGHPVDAQQHRPVDRALVDPGATARVARPLRLGDHAEVHRRQPARHGGQPRACPADHGSHMTAAIRARLAWWIPSRWPRAFWHAYIWTLVDDFHRD